MTLSDRIKILEEQLPGLKSDEKQQEHFERVKRAISLLKKAVDMWKRPGRQGIAMKLEQWADDTLEGKRSIDPDA